MKKRVLGFLLVCMAFTVSSFANENDENRTVMDNVVELSVVTAIVLPSHPVVLRYSGTKDDTLGLLFIDQVFQHYIIEDEFREVKVKGDTRIAAGIYELGLRKTGGFHNRYARKFPEMHKGMIELLNVPKFKYILYHIMNSDKDTAGCIGGGDRANNNQLGKGFVGDSRNAYKRTYPKLLSYMESVNKPIIEIIDLDRKHT